MSDGSGAGGSTFTRAMQKRRKDLRESMTDSTIEMSSQHDTIQMLSADDGGVIDEMETIDPIEELQDAENLVEKLQNDREERRRELFQSLEPAEETDVKPIRQKRKPKATSRDIEEIPTIPETIVEAEEGRVKSSDKGAKPTPAKRKGKKSKEPMSMEDAIMSVKTGMVSEKAPGNLNASIRERIKKKMLQTKEKAEETMREEVEKDPDRDFPARKLRGMRARDTITRFDESTILTKEEIEEDKMLQESIAAKSRWKVAFKAVKAKTSHIPTSEEAYDFFTRNFDPEPEEPEKVAAGDQPGPSSPREEEAQPKSTRDEEEKKDEDKEEDETPLLSEHFLYQDDWKDHPSSMRSAEYMPWRYRQEAEKGYYFVPSTEYINVKEKGPAEAEPRYLEDEGFYVGVKPSVSQRNRNLMEHRLLNRDDKGSQWFGADGLIKALPDPLKDMPSRPRVVPNEEREPALQTVYKKAIVSEFDNWYIDGLGDELGGRYQLDVDVNTLIFTHHSLFSKEHVLASRLRQMYDQYLKRKQKDVAHYLTEKLKALRGAVKTLEEQLVNMRHADPDSSTVQEHQHRLQEYKYEIRQTRRLRDYELQHDRQLLLSIIKTWRDIKALREAEECTNTPVRLGVRKEESNKREDEAVWKADIEDEVSEMREEYEEDYQGEIERYKEALIEWKDYMKQKKANKRKKKQQGSRESLEVLTEANGNEEEEPLEEIPKPTKPSYSFNEDEAKQKTRENMCKIRRKPGEPMLTPELSNTAVITPTSDCSKAEQARRSDMLRCKCFVKVLFNNKEVSRTGTRSMTSDFTLHFGDIFNIQIMQWPESVKLQVFETGTLINTLLAEIFAVVPDTQVTQDKVQLESLDFGSDQRVTYEHSAVGSGYTFHLGSGDTSGEEMQLFTQGQLLASVSWGLAEDNTPLIPPSATHANANELGPLNHLDAVAAIGATGLVDPERLAKWVSEARLDPNDPANANLLHMMRDFQGEGGKILKQAAQFFRLEQLQEEFNFVSHEVLESSKRFRLISLREKEVPEFRNYKMVPLIEKEIPDTAFADYEKRKHMEEHGILEEDVDPHRAAVAKFLGKVRERVMARFRAAQHQYSLPDVVNEDQVPDVSMLSTIILRLIEPKRPLRPQRKERKTVTAQNLSGLQVNLLINIERAIEIPVRKSTGRQDGQSTSYGTVRPFVEVVFQQSIKQTSVAEGPNPNWNEELIVPFQAPNNDYSPSNLQGVKDVIYFNLFDEVLIDMLQDERDRATNIHQRMERRWLGSISMPFSTIYFQNRVSGTFRLNTPSVLLGYDRSPDSMSRIQGGNQTNATYISVFITIEPPLSPPEPLKEKFDSNEDEKLLSYAENYQTSLSVKFPKREVTTSVMDINGKSVFVTRYFRPIKPPAILIEDGNNSLKVAVSIIVSYTMWSEYEEPPFNTLHF
ncbi:coiled-coil and C2 domain-containing protein 2A-like isoform X2 [Amphiura filiformis]|uniref:coiled-coil and C2 domain-containing protein 2A-like isoform X2 n=1 Tax=Amphiura filiformis TaxID=82378 RepID=UPI003B21CC71